MEYSKTQRAAFIKQFSQQKSRSRIASVSLIFLIVAMPALPDQDIGLLFVYQSIGGLATIGLIVIANINWRCPACGRHLGRTWDPMYCSHCGVQLSE